MNRFKGSLLAGVAVAGTFAALGAAHAGGFALREQSALGLGNAFAGAAAGGSGLSSMFWNPATMTDFDGIQTTAILSGIIPYANMTPTTGTSPVLLSLGGSGSSGDIGQDAVLPAAYASWQVAEKIWIGLAINSPFGLVTQNPYNWSGQIYARTSKVATYAANPTIAYKVNDWLSFGVGIQLMKFDVRLTSATSPVPNAATAVLKGDDIAFGFTAGATVKPWAGGEIGIGYRSRVEPKLNGTLTTAAVTPITADVKLPDQFTIGIRQQINQDFTLLAGWEWTHWGLFGRFPVYTTTGVQATALNFDYRDAWFASIGAEYNWNKDLTLRAGLGYEQSPIKGDTRTPRLPDNNRTWATIGASYKWNDKLSFDASYAHLFVQNAAINIVPGNPTLITAPGLGPLPFVASGKGRVDIISFGVTYRWDDPPKASTFKPAIVSKG